MELYNKIRKNIILYKMQIEALENAILKNNIEQEKERIKEFVEDNYTLNEEIEYYEFIKEFVTNLNKKKHKNIKYNSDVLNKDSKNYKISSNDLLKLFATKEELKNIDNKKLELKV